jgi:hypothetical protein
VSAPVVDAQPYADAVKAAMAAQSIPYAEGRKPASVPVGSPYVVGWFDPGRVENRSLRSRDGFSVVVVLQSYGSSPDSVRFAVRKGRMAIASLAGTAAGDRVILPPSHEPPPPMERDDDASPPLWWQSDEWRLRTSPA